MANSRTPNSFLVFVGCLAALVIVAIIFIASIAGGAKPGDLDKKRADNRLSVRSKLEEQARGLIASEGFVDKSKGIVHVPVASLFASSAAELSARKPAPSQVKVEPPLTMPIADPASSEPAQPALPSAPQGADTIRFTHPEPATKPSASTASALSAPIASSASAIPPFSNLTEPK
jgi:hypothetical protein